MSRISSHVLDTVSGCPAAGVELVLKSRTGEELARVVTDQQGRVADFQGRELDQGIYQMDFMVGPYFKSQGRNSFYPVIPVVFEIDGEDHYHIPLILSAYGYSSYRGS